MRQAKSKTEKVIMKDIIAKRASVEFIHPETKKTCRGTFVRWRKSKPDIAVIDDDQNQPVNVHKTKFHVISKGGKKAETEELEKEETWNVNEKFKFLHSYVKFVAAKQMISLIITGDGGLGKTYTVLKQIEDMGLKENEDYVVLGGYSTARGLYNFLFEHSNKLIICDDMDSILEHDVSVNILAKGLDSYEKRMIHWIKGGEKYADEKDAPPSFEFKGHMIFISNLPKFAIPQKLLSRANNIDLTMTIEDKVERMEAIINDIKPNIAIGHKKEAFNELKKYATKCKDFNLRTLIKSIELRTSGEDNWKELIKFMALN